MTRRLAPLLAALSVLALALFIAAKVPVGRTPGRLPDGRTLLPNGWIISPAGRGVEMYVGSLTLALSPDRTRLAVLNCGSSPHSVMIVDPQSERVLEKIPVEHAWLGIVFHPTEARLFVSGGSSGKLWDIALGGEKPRVEAVQLGEELFISGVAASPDGRTVFAGTVNTGQILKVDLQSKQVLLRTPTLGRVYGLLASSDGKRLYASDWLRSRVLVYDTGDLMLRDVIRVGPHPSEMIISADGRLFVTCAEDSTVYIAEARTGEVEEKVKVSVHPLAPEGSAPASLALDEEENRLYVAVADNNCVAVVDVAERGGSRLLGFIPTGWYTSAVRVAGGKVMALASKGSQPKDNADRTYIGLLLKGELHFIDVPDGRGLARYTRRVVENCPYRDDLLSQADECRGSVLPSSPRARSPIRYVIYVIKENRTYDQVLGDIPSGNGDPSLCIYGEVVTPNQHKLAREFALLDNFYVDAEVSADGHNWSMAAYANDYVEKMWPYQYGGHGGSYDFEGENPLSRPGGGYIWDACRRAGVTYRSYGEYVKPMGKGEGVWYEGIVPGLVGHVAPYFPKYDLRIPDVTRYEEWLKEFRQFERKGEMPQLQIVRLPVNHTAGTRPGYRTPRAMVADNDLAVGKLVQAVSHSRFWPETAIFILEDDAQNGPDHVDAHRSVCLVVSSYTRLGVTDSNLYTTCSVLRTMELLLGLPPLNQYDAAASPMYSLFRTPARLKPFDAVPARWPLDELNPENAVMARESLAMRMDIADAIDEDLMNRVLWADAKGPDAPYPTPNRTSIDLLRGRR
jgi:DNA-binding beta-propeller fold protein YncE